jgi:hypothetical protein
VLVPVAVAAVLILVGLLVARRLARRSPAPLTVA